MKKYLQLIFCFTLISCGSGDDESLTPVCPFTVAIINPLTMANFSSVNEDGCTWTVELMNADYCS